MKTIPIPQHNTICFGAVRYEHTWLCYANLTKFEQKFRFGHKFGVVADSVESNGGRLCCDDLFSVFIHSFAFAGQYLHVRKTRCVPFNDVQPCAHIQFLCHISLCCVKRAFSYRMVFSCVLWLLKCVFCIGAAVVEWKSVLAFDGLLSVLCVQKTTPTCCRAQSRCDGIAKRTGAHSQLD